MIQGSSFTLFEYVEVNYDIKASSEQRKWLSYFSTSNSLTSSSCQNFQFFCYKKVWSSRFFYDLLPLYWKKIHIYYDIHDRCIWFFGFSLDFWKKREYCVSYISMKWSKWKLWLTFDEFLSDIVHIIFRSRIKVNTFSIQITKNLKHIFEFLKFICIGLSLFLIWILNVFIFVLDRKMTNAIYDDHSSNVNQTFHLRHSKLMYETQYWFQQWSKHVEGT